MDRIATMERDIILPIKVAGIAMLLYSFYFKRAWIGQKELGTLEITVEATQYFLWVYIAFNVVVAGLLLDMRRVPLLLVQWAVFAMSLVDGIFVSALVVVTGGYDSILYWLFLGLVVRGAVSVPRATSQILLNLTLTACYVMAGSINISINKACRKRLAPGPRRKQAPAYARATNGPPGRMIARPDGTSGGHGADGNDRPDGAGGVDAPGRRSPARRPGRSVTGESDVYTPAENPTQTLTLRLALLLVDDGLLLRGAGVAGAAAAGGRGGARVRHARGPVALRRARGG